MRTRIIPPCDGPIDEAERERKGELAVEAVTAVMQAVMDSMDVEFIAAVCGASTSHAFYWMAEGGLPQSLWEELRDSLAAGIGAMSYADAKGSAGEMH